MGIQLGSFATNFTNRRIIADAHNERKKLTLAGYILQKEQPSCRLSAQTKKRQTSAPGTALKKSDVSSIALPSLRHLHHAQELRRID